VEVVKRFRNLVIRLSLGVTGVAGICAFPINAAFAKGVVMGGLASTLGFSILARNIEVANAPPDRVKFGTRKWLAARMLVYSLTLLAAYRVDAAHLWGFLGAALGLLVVRLTVTFVGVTGWDLTKTE
jgi:hypothetical protein